MEKNSKRTVIEEGIVKNGNKNAIQSMKDG